MRAALHALCGGQGFKRAALSRSTLLGNVGLCGAVLAIASVIALHPDVPQRSEFDLEIAPSAVASLRNNSRHEVPATVRVNGETLTSVGVHLKGATGSFRPVDDTPSMTLDFGRFKDGQTLHGVRKLHLNNSVEDPTRMRELVASDVFRAAGLPLPVVSHAVVRLNGKRLGLYVVKEAYERDYLEREFGVDGPVFEPVPGNDVDGRMKAHGGDPYGLGKAALRRLARAAVEPNLERRWRDLRRSLDMDRFLSLMAVEVMLGHWDGYSLAQNNFRVFYDAGEDRLTFLPAGMDQLFGKADASWRPEMSGLVARAVMEVPAGRQAYIQTFGALFERCFAPEQLTDRLRRAITDLQPVLGSFESEEIRREIAELCAAITQRHASLVDQLSQGEVPSLDFTRSEVVLARWQPCNGSSAQDMKETLAADGKQVWSIAAGPKTSASWRTRVRLPRGRYTFGGEVQAVGVNPLPFGKSHGATLRVAGRSAHSVPVLSAAEWKRAEVTFEVAAAQLEVELACELRASSGEALWRSLTLQRRPDPATVQRNEGINGADCAL